MPAATWPNSAIGRNSAMVTNWATQKLNRPAPVENTTAVLALPVRATISAAMGDSAAAIAQTGQLLKTISVVEGSLAPKSANIARNTGAVTHASTACAE